MSVQVVIPVVGTLTMGADKYTLRPVRVFTGIVAIFPLAFATFLSRWSFLVGVMIIRVHLVLTHLPGFFLKRVLTVRG